MNDVTAFRAEGDLEWSTIAVRGPESELFLQGQVSQDLSDVPTGGVSALLLAPDSVVITSCHVLSLEEGFDLTVPKSLGEAATRRLRRFLLRTKCTLELDERGAGPFSTVAEQVEAGAPGDAEFARALTPHSFGPSFVATTISFTKGCFTGQELVGRLDARGASVPWRLVHVAGPSLEIVEGVLASRGPSGPQGVTSVVRVEHGIVGLAIAHRTLLGGEFLDDVDGVRVEPVT